MAHLIISHYSPGLIYYKTLPMYPYCSDNIHFAVSADIEGMFLQFGVLPFDQQSLRFLWQEDPTSNVVVQQYMRHIFGAEDSSTSANYAIQVRTASDIAKEYPEAAKAVLENCYMDHFLNSAELSERALIRSKELVNLFNLGGFNLISF